MSFDDAEEIITKFELRPHPFDGWCTQIDNGEMGPARFHYLIKIGELAPWHQAAGQLIFTHIDGAPLKLIFSEDGKHSSNRILNRELNASSVMVPPAAWRTWESLGPWSLMIASVDRRNDFLNWDLAPDNWHPN